MPRVGFIKKSFCRWQAETLISKYGQFEHKSVLLTFPDVIKKITNQFINCIFFFNYFGYRNFILPIIGIGINLKKYCLNHVIIIVMIFLKSSHIEATRRTRYFVRQENTAQMITIPNANGGRHRSIQLHIRVLYRFGTYLNFG